MSVLDTLNAASTPRRRVSIYTDGAAQVEHDRLFEELENTDATSLADTSLRDKAQELDAVRDRMVASEVTFEFEGMDWTERLALQAEHPPRDGNIADRIQGFNIATYFPALIRRCCVSATDVNGDTVTEVPAATWDNLLGRAATDDAPAVRGRLHMAAVDKLARTAQAVNDKETTVPPSALSYLASQDSGASLERPSPGTSARSDSEGGSRPTSPRSSTTKKGRKKAGSDAS